MKSLQARIKEECILVDIHKTIINKDNSYNDVLLNILNLCSKFYKIVFYTSRFYKDKSELQDELRNISFKFDVYHNLNSDFDDDIEIKKELYKIIKKKYKIVIIIDNNKKITKKFNKKTDVLTFKKRKQHENS